MDQKKQREAWIDIVKGLAIIFVVIGHVVTSYHNSGLLKEAKAFNFVCDFLYTFHMPLFFAISGYLNNKTQRDEPLGRAVARRCVVYGIPYVVFSVVAYGLKVVAAAVVNSKLEFLDLLLIPIYPISSLWFIYALLLVSVLQLILKNLFGRKRYGYAVLLVSLLVKIVAHWIGTLEVVKNSSFSQCILFDVAKYWFWYVLGEWSVQILTEEKRQQLSKISNGICVVATILFAGVVYITPSNVLLDVIMSLVGTVLCCIWAMKISQSRILEYLGKQTFPIYLLHGYVVSFARVVLSRLHIPLMGGVVPLVVCTVLGIILPLVAYGITTKIRGLDFVFYPGKYLLLKRQK